MKDDDSGFRWGPFEIHDEARFQGLRPLKTEQKGGCVHYPYPLNQREKSSQHLRQVDTSRPIIHKGNHFADFTHARDYPPDAEWYFWDNCLLPQLMYRSQANPRGGKQWTRIVLRSTMPGLCRFTDREIDLHERRVTDRLRALSQGQCRSWRDLCPTTRREQQGRTVLLALSSDQALSHWYGLTRQDIETQVRQVCDRWGWQLDLRVKPTRAERENGGSIRDQLRSKNYRCVVTVNSAAAIECLAEGVAVVALGAHSIGTLSTPWAEFKARELRIPETAQVDRRMQELVCLTWHKEELLEGTWAQSKSHTGAEPYNQWWINFD